MGMDYYDKKIRLNRIANCRPPSYMVAQLLQKRRGDMGVVSLLPGLPNPTVIIFVKCTVYLIIISNHALKLLHARNVEFLSYTYFLYIFYLWEYYFTIISTSAFQYVRRVEEQINIFLSDTIIYIINISIYKQYVLITYLWYSGVWLWWANENIVKVQRKGYSSKPHLHGLTQRQPYVLVSKHVLGGCG